MRGHRTYFHSPYRQLVCRGSGRIQAIVRRATNSYGSRVAGQIASLSRISITLPSTHRRSRTRPSARHGISYPVNAEHGNPSTIRWTFTTLSWKPESSHIIGIREDPQRIARNLVPGPFIVGPGSLPGPMAEREHQLERVGREGRSIDGRTRVFGRCARCFSQKPCVIHRTICESSSVRSTPIMSFKLIRARDRSTATPTPTPDTLHLALHPTRSKQQRRQRKSYR